MSNDEDRQQERRLKHMLQSNLGRQKQIASEIERLVKQRNDLEESERLIRRQLREVWTMPLKFKIE